MDRRRSRRCSHARCRRPTFRWGRMVCGAPGALGASRLGARPIEGFEVLAREMPHKGGRTFGYRISDGRIDARLHARSLPDRAWPRSGWLRRTIIQRCSSLPRRRTCSCMTRSCSASMSWPPKGASGMPPPSTRWSWAPSAGVQDGRALPSPARPHRSTRSMSSQRDARGPPNVIVAVQDAGAGVVSAMASARPATRHVDAWSSAPAQTGWQPRSRSPAQALRSRSMRAPRAPAAAAAPQELTLPGFTHDVCSTVHPLLAASPFFRDAGLGA